MPEVYTARISELNANARGLLQVYMAWYTFYWALNVSVLAWVYASKASIPVLLGVFFACMCIVAAVSSFVVLKAVLALNQMMTALSSELVRSLRQHRVSASLLKKDLMPAPVLQWGLCVNGGCTALLGAVWVGTLF